jgi:membrane protein implicated in regulation of membrane protease activity
MALVVAVLLAVFIVPAGWDLAVVAAGAAVELGEAGFWWRWSHRHRPVVGAEALVGAIGVVVDPCNPEGRVRVGGELWTARCDDGAKLGTSVRVTGVTDLTLVVEPA